MCMISICYLEVTGKAMTIIVTRLSYLFQFDVLMTIHHIRHRCR